MRRGCKTIHLDWTSIRMGDLLRRSIKGASVTHLVKRPFVCDIDDCQMSYRTKDHLKRHLIQNQGKLFKCTAKDCNKEFCAQSNLKRHFKNMHELKPMCDSVQEKKKYVCQEVGCGKEFLYEFRLRKHEESHVTLDSVEVFCIGCNKPFSNKQCLKAHLASCHRHVTCEVCGCQHLRKNIHRHLCSHEVGSPETIKCDFEDCGRTFSKNTVPMSSDTTALSDDGKLISLS